MRKSMKVPGCLASKAGRHHREPGVATVNNIGFVPAALATPLLKSATSVSPILTGTRDTIYELVPVVIVGNAPAAWS